MGHELELALDQVNDKLAPLAIAAQHAFADFDRVDLLTPVKEQNKESYKPAITNPYLSNLAETDRSGSGIFTGGELLGGALIAGTALAGVAGFRYQAGAAARSLVKMERLEARAVHLKEELARPIEYLRTIADKTPKAVVKESEGMFSAFGRTRNGNMNYKIEGNGWLSQQKDGGILFHTKPGEPYVRFFQDGGFESGSKYVMDQGGFFISPTSSLRRLNDGSSILWERGPIGKLSFFPSEAAKSEPWASTVSSLIEQAKAPVLKNFWSSIESVNLNSALARELRSANPKEVFALIPSSAKPIGAGREALVLKTEDNFALRISRTHSDRPAELREFLLPAESVTRGVGWQIEKVPFLEQRVFSRSKIWALDKGVQSRGYYLTDAHPGNLRLLDGKAVLIDPGAVSKLQPVKLERHERLLSQIRATADAARN